jgi:hypothetical protein
MAFIIKFIRDKIQGPGALWKIGLPLKTLEIRLKVPV